MIEKWLDGLEYLLTDDLIDFYAFFTTIFAEIAFLWAFFPENALAITIILLVCIANVVICAYLKGACVSFCIKGKRYGLADISKPIWSIVYCIVFLIAIIAALIINGIGAVLIMIPIAVAGIWIKLREWHNTTFIGEVFKISAAISEFLYKHKIICIIYQVFIILIPFATFTVFLAFTSIGLILKIIIPIVYLLVSPFIAYIEDELLGETIFEIPLD